ncbi:7-carboxy-7-deazaguanine synthase QueE [bacterium]|nr:7-carboxy-7-deazaguanine synthase QueE [bacterium]
MFELPKAFLYEIFSGIQGEGLYVGERELFIRFCGCNLRCPYCDTKFALENAPTCLVERRAGEREFDPFPNPLSPKELLNLIAPLLENKRIHHSLFLTGGEPLIWGDFLAIFLPQARYLNLPISLETNGTLPSELEKIIRWIDIISMDYKLLSTMEGKDYSQAHKEFLRISKQKEVVIKFVITSQVELKELEEALLSLREEGDFPIILQPVSPIDDIFPPPEPKLLKMQELARGIFSVVKVLPQMHKIMGTR